MVRMGENECRVLVEKSAGKQQLGRSRRRENDFKMCGIGEDCAEYRCFTIGAEPSCLTIIRRTANYIHTSLYEGWPENKVTMYIIWLPYFPTLTTTVHISWHC
jgi:hypothetical protein